MPFCSRTTYLELGAPGLPAIAWPIQLLHPVLLWKDEIGPTHLAHYELESIHWMMSTIQAMVLMQAMYPSSTRICTLSLSGQRSAQGHSRGSFLEGCRTNSGCRSPGACRLSPVYRWRVDQHCHHSTKDCDQAAPCSSCTRAAYLQVCI